MSPTIRFGNASPNGVDAQTSTTTFILPDDVSPLEALRTLDDAWGLNGRPGEGHSDDPPEWVDGDSPTLVGVVADHFGATVGRPEDWPADPTGPTDGEAS